MAKHPVTNITPPLVDDQRFNRNGMVPDATLMARLANGFNYVSSRCKKQILLKCQSLGDVAAGDPANVVWPAYFRTGENTSGLRVALGVVVTDFGFTSPPEANLIVRTTAPATVIDKSWTFSVSKTGTAVSPDEIAHVQDVVTGLEPNTEYTMSFQMTNGARVVYASIVEADTRHADDTLTAVCDPSEFMAEGPIYDAQIADLVEANNELWRHNGAHLIQWCADYDEDDGPTVTSTSYINIMGGSATVTASTPGWTLHTQYHNTVNRTTVPVKLAIKTDRTVGAGTLSIKLTDGTNSIEITGIADVDGWSTVTANIPAQAGTKWDLHVKVTSGTFRINALALFEYEA